MELLATQLNTLVIESTWNPEDTSHDAEIESLSRTLLDICKKDQPLPERQVTALHTCGVANFSLSYLFALRGKTIASARRASKAIEALETAIELDPDRADPGLHLGLLYYYADNLPSFVKAVGRVLWFIPTGKSELAMPYLRRSSCCGEGYREGARFILADILTQGNDADRIEAVDLLYALVADYPANARLHYNLLETLSSLRRYEEVLIAHQATDQLELSDLKRSALDIWRASALIELNRLDEAERLLADISDAGQLPGWLDEVLTDAEASFAHRRVLALR